VNYNRVYEEEAEALIGTYLDDESVELTCKREVLVREIVDILVAAQNEAYDLIDNNTKLKAED
jgi:hypothetical protein